MRVIIIISYLYKSYITFLVCINEFRSRRLTSPIILHNFRQGNNFPSFRNHSQFTIHELTILERLKVNEPILENSLRHLLQISIDLVVQLYLPVERRKDGGYAALRFKIG